jgi:hypothetical protein
MEPFTSKKDALEWIKQASAQQPYGNLEVHVLIRNTTERRVDRVPIYRYRSAWTTVPPMTK